MTLTFNHFAFVISETRARENIGMDSKFVFLTFPFGFIGGYLNFHRFPFWLPWKRKMGLFPWWDI